MFGLLLAMMFLPHQTVKMYPKPDPACLYNWVSDPSKLENRCDAVLVVDIAYKNGLGTQAEMNKGDVVTMHSFPAKVFMCTQGQGTPSAATDHFVHPGFKTNEYACLTQELEFPFVPVQPY